MKYKKVRVWVDSLGRFQGFVKKYKRVSPAWQEKTSRDSEGNIHVHCLYRPYVWNMSERDLEFYEYSEKS